MPATLGVRCGRDMGREQERERGAAHRIELDALFAPLGVSSNTPTILSHLNKKRR